MRLLPARYARPRLIDRGGMAELYAATDRELDRRVAVKVLSDDFADDPEIRDRFEREARTASQLSDHPHIVTIFDVGTWHDRPYIVMELLPGGTVADRIAAGDVTPGQALAWLAQVASALDAAHAAGIVHRDVKPSNLLFDARGDLSIADFGIARVLDSDQPDDTLPGTVLGTAGYLPPEQARGEPATAASDIYSLGVVAGELLAVAFAGSVPSPAATVLDHASSANPNSRPASAGELVSALEATLEEEQPTVVVAAPVPLHRRRGVPLAVAAAVALFGGGGLAAVALRPGAAPPPPAKGAVTPPPTASSAARHTAPTATHKPPPPVRHVLHAQKTKRQKPKTNTNGKHRGKHEGDGKRKGTTTTTPPATTPDPTPTPPPPPPPPPPATTDAGTGTTTSTATTAAVTTTAAATTAETTTTGP